MKKLLSILMLLVAIVTGAKADTESISWTGTDNTLSPLTATVTGSHLSDASTEISLTGMSSTSSSKTGYFKPIYPSSASTSFSATTYASLSFSVADGYTFTPSSFSMTLQSYGTDARKAKVVISDTKGHSVTSDEWTESKNTDKAVSFTNAFVAMEGTITIKLHVYGLSSEGSGKRFYVKKPIAISGTTTAKAPEVKYDVTYKAGAGTGEDVQENVSVVGDCPEGFTPPTGKSFTGWNTASDGSGTPYAVGDAVNSDLTLFAQWAKFYSVEYNLGAGTSATGAPTQADVEDGKTFNVAAVPTDLVAPAGKEFKCWNDGTTDYNPGDTYTIGGVDVTLTAVYQDRTFAGLTPSATLDFANPGATFASVWHTTLKDNNPALVKNFYYDAPNGKVVMSAYAVYQAVNNEKIAWEKSDSNNSSAGTWEATGDFKGSNYYFEENNDARAANIQASARVHYYRVTGITGVSANFSGKAAIEAYEVNAGVVFPDYAKQNKITSAGTATITELDVDKEYVILVRGDNGSSGIRFYEIAFTFPPIIGEDLDLSNTEGYNYGFGGYCSANNFTVSNGKAYKASLNNSKIVLTELEGVIPANTGVIIAGEKGATATINYTTDDATANMEGNSLHGTLTRTLTATLKGDAAKFLTLQKSTSKFIQYTGEYFPANRAYLLIESASAPESLEMVFADEATAIKEVNADENANSATPVKVIKGGKLYIGNYNVAGQLVK